MGALQDKKLYAQNISILRYEGKINEAIVQCKTATEKYPADNFFFKILGDLYMDLDCYEMAATAYFENLKRISRPELFRTFVRFYERIRQKVDEEFLASYQSRIMSAIKKHEISEEISEKIVELWKRREFIASPKLQDLAHLSDSDVNYNEVKDQFNELSNHKDFMALSYLLQYRVNSSVARRTTKKIDTYLVQVMERHEQYKDAQALLEKMVLDSRTCTKDIIASFLRVCRKQSDYSDVKKCLTIDNNFISSSDFNIQYELVYFFESLGDIDNVKAILNQIKRSATRSPPISRTLYNFYLRFNMFDEANSELSRLSMLLANGRSRGDSRIEEQQESEQAVWQKLKDLVSEQEHNRQMIALRDLLKGFSHELGQPITNIRYNTQLYQLRKRKGIDSTEDVDELLELILRQTQRIGKLLDRFRPIVSSKSNNTSFNVMSRIQEVFQNLSSRLEIANIKYSVCGNNKTVLWGDPIQFDQIFYNLILNSMQAMEEISTEKKIEVSIRNFKSKISIWFSDTGPGIPEEFQAKIFEPFFTTKDPSQQSGGEGLGLFIIWNILKIFNGNITLDKGYLDGARFLITILPEEGANDEHEQSINH